MDLQLNRIRQLLDLLGSPEKRLKCVHVTGTNGKGTTGCYLSSFLFEAAKGKINIAQFSSPHLLHPRDCIRLNTRPIGPEEYNELVEIVDRADSSIGAGCTSFEKLTAAAFLYFAQKEASICVIEVGLGGRLDATNVISTPELCLFTSIGLDHVDMLGGTIEAIAKEKSGIIKRGTTVISAALQDKAALSVIQQTCDTLDVPLSVSEISSDVQESSLSVPQKINLSLAISAFEAIQSNHPDLFESLGRQDLINTAHNITWPGRMEWLYIEPVGLVLVDGAHNEAGLQALRSFVSSLQKPTTWILGFKGGKDLQNLFNHLLIKGDQVIITEYEGVEGMPWIKSATIEEMQDALNKIPDKPNNVTSYKHISELFHTQTYRKVSRQEVTDRLAQCSQIHVVCGSLYLITSLFKHIKYEI